MESNYIDHLPEISHEQTEQLPFRYEDYPFFDIRRFDDVRMLHLLFLYVTRRLPKDCAVHPLNFTRYCPGTLYSHFMNTGSGLDLTKFPIFFFSHWVTHPSKRVADFCQKTSDPNVTTSIWRKSGKLMPIYEYRKAMKREGTIVGYKQIYDLWQSYNHKPEKKNGRRLHEYTVLSDDVPRANDSSGLMRTAWAVYKLCHRETEKSNFSCPIVDNNYIDHLPEMGHEQRDQPLVDDLCKLSDLHLSDLPFPSYDNYPFVDLCKLSDLHLFDMLWAYISRELPKSCPIHPLNFTKYCIETLESHFSNTGDLNNFPLLFFSHWVGHPSKEGIDFCQKSLKENVLTATWRKTSDPIPISECRKGKMFEGEVVGHKTIYALWESYESGEYLSDKELHEITLDPSLVSCYGPDLSGLKMSDWGVYKLCVRQ